MLIYGHRGARAEAPENTLASFSRALQAGVDRVELDLHLARDGELVVIHEQAMRERLQDFGADFVGRNLPGFLFTAADYVRAQRERRRMVDEMTPLYEQFDVLLTASAAPAAAAPNAGAMVCVEWPRPRNASERTA